MNNLTQRPADHSHRYPCSGPANEEEKESFLKEIEMMKSVSSTSDELSRFVVNMLGCITRAEPLMLVVEYVKYGNLLNFLRNLRKRIEVSSNNHLVYTCLMHSYCRQPRMVTALQYHIPT